MTPTPGCVRDPIGRPEQQPITEPFAVRQLHPLTVLRHALQGRVKLFAVGVGPCARLQALCVIKPGNACAKALMANPINITPHSRVIASSWR